MKTIEEVLHYLAQTRGDLEKEYIARMAYLRRYGYHSLQSERESMKLSELFAKWEILGEVKEKIKGGKK